MERSFCSIVPNYHTGFCVQLTAKKSVLLLYLKCILFIYLLFMELSWISSATATFDHLKKNAIICIRYWLWFIFNESKREKSVRGIEILTRAGKFLFYVTIRHAQWHSPSFAGAKFNGVKEVKGQHGLRIVGKIMLGAPLLILNTRLYPCWC